MVNSCSSPNTLDLKTIKPIGTPHHRPPLTIKNKTVIAVEFLGTTISQELKWESNTDSISQKCPAEALLPVTAEESQFLPQKLLDEF